jgi:hypothetical protein
MRMECNDSWSAYAESRTYRFDMRCCAAATHDRVSTLLSGESLWPPWSSGLSATQVPRSPTPSMLGLPACW